MIIEIPKLETPPEVDRDDSSDDVTTQGLNVLIDGVVLHFEDEGDALQLARAIAKRLGHELVAPDRTNDSNRPRASQPPHSRKPWIATTWVRRQDFMT